MTKQTILDDFDFEGNELPRWAEEGEVVAKFFSAMEAEVAAARLRAEGVHCFLANTTVQTLMPHLQMVIRLHVRPQDAAIAREILHEAAIEVANPRSNAVGREGILIMAILIGLLLAYLLVKAMAL